MSPVRLSVAFFLGAFLQTLLVGTFVPLFILASYAQWKKVSRGRKIHLITAFTTVFFGLTIIAHWILGMRRMMLASLYLPPDMSVDQYFLPPYGTDEIARRAIFQLQIVIGDSIMIYRMYHIYEKSLLACVIPSITTAGLLAIGCGVTNQLRNLNTPAELKASDDLATACYCVTLFNSAFMSAAISLRLWKVHLETAVSINMKNSVILRVMKVLVEGAALWTLFVSINFFAFLSKSNLKYTFLDMTSPVVGISFCLIIVRLGTMTPEVREDSWESFQRSQVSKILPVSDLRQSKLPISFDRVKAERDVYISESESSVVVPYDESDVP
ncbi:hypothetical protein BDM02DRAFT_3188775 [Thelephora ganbajun]|uniref:Uncharacterized protein n=1 Tax=Thelephora ganbajun TaxID=370292 RepID=A0ACB6Z9V7_THEGA|nr:hypothetical protein BDM02DRAFT_3188775 [Thelephora ganbajun]